MSKRRYEVEGAEMVSIELNLTNRGIIERQAGAEVTIRRREGLIFYRT